MSSAAFFVARRLAAAPGFAAPVVITLALGMALVGVSLTLLDQLWWRPLQVDAPERLFGVIYQSQQGSQEALSGRQAQLWQEAAEAHAAIAVLADAGTESALVVGTQSLLLPGVHATSHFAEVLGTRLVSGRQPLPNARDEILISEDALQRLALDARSALGQRARVNGESVTIVGVLPAQSGHVPDVDLVLPLDMNARAILDRGQNTFVLARIPAERDVTAAISALDAIGARLVRTEPGALAANSTLRLVDASVILSGRLRGGTRSLGWMLVGCIAAVLMLMTGTIAIVTLARTIRKRSEYAVRNALGASAGMLLRERLSEVLVLLLPSLLLGCALLLVLLALVREGMADWPRMDELAPGVGLAAQLLGAIGLVVLFGLLLPGIGGNWGARRQLSQRAEIATARWQRALVVIQIAFCFALFAGFTLMYSSVQQMLDEQPGFRVEGTLTATLSLTSAKYRDPATATIATVATLDALRDALKAIPGVREVATATSRPMERGLNDYFQVSRKGEPFGQSVQVRAVGGDYLGVLGIPMQKGRMPLAGERAIAVNEAFAKTFFPEANALGAAVGVDAQGPIIVGIVADVRDIGFDTGATATVYMDRGQMGAGLQSLVNGWFPTAVMIHAAPGAVSMPVLQSALRRIDADLAWRDLQPLQQVLATSMRSQRFLAQALATLALSAAALAAVGLFAALNFMNSVRQRELALRVAMGARNRQLVTMVLAQVARWTAAGAVLGVMLTYAARQSVESFAYETTVLAPGVLATAAMMVMVIALCAAMRPLHAILHVQPNQALRGD